MSENNASFAGCNDLSELFKSDFLNAINDILNDSNVPNEIKFLFAMLVDTHDEFLS